MGPERFSWGYLGDDLGIPGTTYGKTPPSSILQSQHRQLGRQQRRPAGCGTEHPVPHWLHRRHGGNAGNTAPGSPDGGTTRTAPLRRG